MTRQREQRAYAIVMSTASDACDHPRQGATHMQKEMTPGVISDPEILGGRPVLRGRRVAVSQLVDQIAGGMTLSETQDDYQLSDEEIRALVGYIAKGAGYGGQ